MSVEAEMNINDLNPYLNGPFAPVDKEITVAELEVIGEIPQDLHGAYYRNGPNPQTRPTDMHHWFDGDGMIHAIYFEEGRAQYRNRYVRTHDFEAERAGRPERHGIFKPANLELGGTPYKDTGNTDVVVHNGDLLALWYISGQPVRLDPETLETLGTQTFGGSLPKNVSAHSKVDAKTNEFVFFDYELYEPFYSVGVVDQHNKLTNFMQIELPGPRLPHDMAITENYAVLMDLPVVFTEQGLKRKTWNIHQNRNLPARFGVVPRMGSAGDIRWFEFPGFYIYHVVNAWEEGDNVVMYACKMVDNNLKPDSQYGPYAKLVTVMALRAVLCKWTLNMRTGECREEMIDDSMNEFPVINLGLTGRKTRYSYHGSLAPTQTQLFDGVLKYDLEKGTHQRYMFAQNHHGTEPAFAPKIDARDEDDGYVITHVNNIADLTTETIILDAKDITQGPIARVKIPQRIPMGFHGTWANADEMRPRPGH